MSPASSNAEKKRKLSAGAGNSSSAQIKRSKSSETKEVSSLDDGAQEQTGNTEEGVGESDAEDGDNASSYAEEGSVSEAGDDTPDAGPAGGSGRSKVFYLWSDALLELFEGESSEAIFRLKSAVEEAWKELKGNEDDDDFCYAENMTHWGADVEDGDQENKAAKALAEKWETDKKSKGRKKAPRWWEVTMQRAKPKNSSTAALKLELIWMAGPQEEEMDGTWYMVDIVRADESKKGNPALHYFANNIPYVD